MSNESDAFEQMIARIYDMLLGANNKVTWNDKVPDPDNPSRLRQIDISIVSSSQTTYVECRIHKEKQNVKWIEELHGRKQSLGIDKIVAVSSAGFTKGAIIKAKRFEIELRDTIKVKENFLNLWGSINFVNIEYFKFDLIHLDLEFPSKEFLDKVPIEEIRDAVARHSIILNGIYDLMPLKPLVEESNPQEGQIFNARWRVKLEEPIVIRNHNIFNCLIRVERMRLVRESIPEIDSMLFNLVSGDDSVKDVSIHRFGNEFGEVIAHPGKHRISLGNFTSYLPDNSIPYKVNCHYNSKGLSVLEVKPIISKSLPVQVKVNPYYIS